MYIANSNNYNFGHFVEIDPTISGKREISRIFPPTQIIPFYFKKLKLITP